MKKYLAVFVAPVESYDKMKEVMQNKSPEEKKQEMDAWTQWMQAHTESIVDHGGGVGSAKRITEDGSVTDTHNEIGGYMVVQAEDAETAVRIFKDSPHFGVVGAGVELMEIMQM